MLSEKEFINFILKGPEESTATKPTPSTESALPEGFEGFEGFEYFGETHAAPSSQTGSSFARRLLEASGFGYPEFVQRDKTVRVADDAVGKRLPERVAYWRPDPTTRPYHTLLFEADVTHRELLSIPAFKTRRISHLEDVESALARMVSEALDGFQRGGEGVTADVRKGRKEETLCVVSIIDERDGEPVRLVCFGTQNKSTNGLETFQFTEQTRFWDPQLARDHLALLYERQFKKLGGRDWQAAFTTTEERKQADKLLAVCTRKAPREHDIQESVLDLLDMIAKSFGLRKRSKTDRRLQAFALPSDHDIGIDPEERESSFGGKNPFGGVTLRDERSRLLGYIVYPLKSKSDAARLRKHLKKNNRFHNVLVVYPDQDQASVELWQGQDQLTGKLRKGQGYKDAADVVNLLSRFFVVSKAKVKNPTELAQELAYRARYLRRLAVKQLEDEPEKGPLRNLYNAFKEALVHDQTEDEFADAFAQTITYGLLTARWTGNDELMANGERLTRQTALKHLPAASPFLNDLFKSALSVKLDEQRGRLLWLVDDIADLLDRIDVTYVFGMGDKNSDTATDPVIHFYEPFLAAYDKELKNKRGVFFTPRPVVSYIVRSVHELLQKEFGLEDGLASTDTWGVVAKRIKGLKIPEGVKASDPFVCILDPATGTGTFLFECIEVIERTMKDGWCRELGAEDWEHPAVVSRWKDYVSKHLLGRLFGYELMMASYAIAHLKLSLKLNQTSYRLAGSDHFDLYLTNTLEQPSNAANPKLASLFDTLAKQAQAVNNIKRGKRFTVVVGNPPYAGLSANMADEAQKLVDAYKIVDGAALNERKLWLQDDYVKFIRNAQTTIETTGAGVLGYITNHGYLDNPTFRGMRQSLLATFGRLQALDLHGNANKKEQAPDGSEDKNVFDIRQGVAVCLAVRHGVGKTGVDHAERWGAREAKYEWLDKNTTSTTSWQRLSPDSPFYFFEPASTNFRTEYESGWRVNDIFPVNCAGFITARDHFVVSFDRDSLLDKMAEFADAKNSDATIRQKFFAGRGSKKYADGDTRGWKVPDARKRVRADKQWKERVVECLYRPFDVRSIYWADWMVDWPRPEVMRHLFSRGGIALSTSRSVEIDRFEHVWCADLPIGHHTVTAKEVNYVFPLFLTPDDQGSMLRLQSTREANFAPAFLKALSSALGRPQRSGGGLPEGTTVEEVFGYIYSVLHSPTYRTRYFEYLRSDFPRIPLPTTDLFGPLSGAGIELVQHHLLKHSYSQSSLPTLVGKQGVEVEKASFDKGTIWIDKKKTAGFKGASEDVWRFRVGGYQICDKWLKDRRGRYLSKAETEQYRTIIAAIGETVRCMKAIDAIVDKHGGWPGAFVTKSGGGKK